MENHKLIFKRNNFITDQNWITAVGYNNFGIKHIAVLVLS